MISRPGLAGARYGYYNEKSDFGFKVAAAVKKSDKADLRGEAGDGNWTAEMDHFENTASVSARAVYRGFSAGFLMEDKNASYATSLLGVPAEGMTPVLDHGINWHIRFINSWARYAYEKQKTWSFFSTVYYRNATVLDDSVPVIEAAAAGLPGRQYRYYRPNSLVGGEAQLFWTPCPGWRLTFGLVLEGEQLAEEISITESAAENITPPVPAEPSRLTNSLFSGYAQARVALAKGLDLFFGARHDESSYYGSVTTPRAGRPIAVLLAAAFALASTGPVVSGVPAAAQAEAEVKAVFLFQFLRYLEWPEDNGLAYCPIVVLGDSSVYEPLLEIAEKKAPGPTPIKVKRCAGLKDAGLPRILFISDSAADLLPAALEKYRKTDTLIVGESEGQAARGAAINFVLREDSVRFEINVKALKAAGIQAGAQLLRLAILVDGEKEVPGR